ncbi:MAG: DUF1302 domain-containing protein [Nevskiaceae bacterium]
MYSSLTKLATFAGGMLLAGAAGAVEFELGGAAVTVSNKLSLGAAWRMEDPDPDLIGIGNGGNAFSTNGDDGNLAWDKGDMVASALKFTSDVSMSMGDYGLFVRGSGVYNQALEDADLFDPTDYQPTAMREQPLSELQAREKAIKDHVGTDFDLLDAYVFGRWEVFDRSLLVKVGRQVLNWGESVFVQHGLNALVAADVNQLRVPGWEIEEVQTPVGMALVSFDVWENIGIEGFYQYEWQETIIDAPGTFLSTNDFAGIGGTQANIGFGRIAENHTASVSTDPTTWCIGPPNVLGPPPAPQGSPCIPFGSTVPRGATVKPSDSGQFGGKLSFYVPFLNDMDLSFYTANYHSRLPVLSGTSRTGPTTSADTANYFVEYPEDIQLYGLSFNTTIPWLDVAVQGEYSLKVGQPLQVDDVELLLAGLGAAGQISPIAGATLGGQYLRGWRRFDVDQVDLSVTKIIGPIAWLGSDQLSLFVETGFVSVRDLPSPTVLAFDAPATSTLNAGTAALNPSTAFGLPVVPYEDYADSYSFGYKVAGRFTYNNVFNAFTVEPTVLLQHDVSGTTPTPIVNFVEGRQQLNLILAVNYLQAWDFNLGYAMYSGADTRNLIADRDYLDFSIKYSF